MAPCGLRLAPELRHSGAMDLKPFVDRLRVDFVSTAELGGEQARAVAERLIGPLESAVRLTLMSVVSAVADEITREIAPGSVEVRLRGQNPSFVITPPEHDVPLDDVMADGGFGDLLHGWAMHGVPTPDEEGATARINFRPPEHLKARIEEAARREGLSVNAWLVRAVGTVLESGGRAPEARGVRSERRYTGWVR
jgi:predicted HicB family RNase H-like nuclease